MYLSLLCVIFSILDLFFILTSLPLFLSLFLLFCVLLHPLSTLLCLSVSILLSLFVYLSICLSTHSSIYLSVYRHLPFFSFTLSPSILNQNLSLSILIWNVSFYPQVHDIDPHHLEMLYDVLKRVLVKPEVSDSHNKNNAGYSILFEAISLIISDGLDAPEHLRDQGIVLFQLFVSQISPSFIAT